MSCTRGWTLKERRLVSTGETEIRLERQVRHIKDRNGSNSVIGIWKDYIKELIKDTERERIDDIQMVEQEVRRIGENKA